MKDQFKIQWRDSGREPECPPDPAYPEGVDLDLSVDDNQKTCVAKLAYPAKRIGLYQVECRLCHRRAGCTTAGRPDDPRSIKIPCKFQ